jgi:2-polyprenyl-3-methyl-5-hydroxy-6-metoxy-1,4-benzoquinol methylase
MDKEKSIVASWQANAGNWINIIEANGIESRKLVTNKAIVEAVCAVNPSSTLDIGCGEGWLSKVFFDHGITVTGIDVIPELVANASQKVPGHFLVASYEDVYRQKISFPEPFDAIVINFALIGKESTEQLLASLPALLTDKGVLFIQTLHPYSRKAMDDYKSGWKTGSWDGLGDQFTSPYEWYFRTWEDWLQLLHDSGFGNVTTHEVMHPENGKALSVIFKCSRDSLVDSR